MQKKIYKFLGYEAGKTFLRWVGSAPQMLFQLTPISKMVERCSGRSDFIVIFAL